MTRAAGVIEFDDSDFVAAHGVKPRGNGAWAFEVAGEVWWESGLLTYAKLKIRTRIRKTRPSDVEGGYIMVKVLG